MIQFIVLCVLLPRHEAHLLSDCVCHLDNDIHDCACSSKSVDKFNNDKIQPILKQLLQKDCFRYYKVDMYKECPWWPSGSQCTSRECGIESCDDEVPAALKLKRTPKLKECQQGDEIDPLDKHISPWQKEQFLVWAEHDDMQDKYCDVDDEDSDKLHYVDLTRNPERYTGYKGSSAQQVWKSIYQENCFKPDPKFDKNYLRYPFSLNGASGLTEGTWHRNVDMFKYRFGAEYTNGEGPQRLKNLYFLYLLELRALQKVAPYLSQDLFYTGSDENDMETMDLISKMIHAIESFQTPFDENSLFQGDAILAMSLKAEFRAHFMNISRIMDCVDCDKCRLWGKLQTHGIGTALRILFSDLPRVSHVGQVGVRDRKRFQLQRNDVVALFNSFARLSSNIHEVGEFQKILSSSVQ
ncbi:unnamed protein product [Soboliphyme baturini]|uniref:Endoplasmic oxidoreductin-1 n=1 Tax=Soboliphyme baturini TaxID=241478 RepID=A0A183IGY3_9BILA|nr:unnamed protein product [Soboliphyme baturini]